MKNLLLRSTIIGAVTLMSIAPTFALTQDVTTLGTTKIPVTADIESSFTVSVPKTLDITNGTTQYDVSIIGDIASNEKLKVIPSPSVEMTEANAIKTAVNASVTQNKTEWTYDEIVNKTTTQGVINVQNLTAGDWRGVLEFNISIEKEEKPISFLLYHGSMESTPDYDPPEPENVELPNQMSIKEWIDNFPNFGTATNTSVTDNDGCKLYKYTENNQYKEITDTSVMLEESAKYVFK